MELVGITRIKIGVIKRRNTKKTKRKNGAQTKKVVTQITKMAKMQNLTGAKRNASKNGNRRNLTATSA